MADATRDFSALRQRLESRLAELRSRADAIQSQLRRPGNRDSEEHALEAENDEVLEHLDAAEAREIEAIRAALGRIESGSYGTCSRCGGPIDGKRLQALPYATSCIRCAS